MHASKTVIRLILILFLPFQVDSQQIDYKGFPEWSWQKEQSTEYMFYAPSTTEPGKKYPLAVFLHGCCGEDDHATLRNAVDPPVRMWHHFGENHQLEPTYIMAPKTTREWKQKFPDIKTAIDKLISAGKIDASRIYMTGFSLLPSPNGSKISKKKKVIRSWPSTITSMSTAKDFLPVRSNSLEPMQQTTM
jgi:predicted dienelactone hydrolase